MEYPYKSYTKTQELLSALKNENNLTVDYFKSILNSIHQEGIISKTLYSNIFDLKNRIVYLYNWHQFDEVTVLNVYKELAKGTYYVRIKDLFSKETVNNASRGYLGKIVLLVLSIIIGTMAIVFTIHFIVKRKRKTTVGNNDITH